jgi:PAS domain S-box-containing protein
MATESSTLAFIYLPDAPLCEALLSLLQGYCEITRLSSFEAALAASHSGQYQVGFIGQNLEGHTLAKLTAQSHPQTALILILPQQDHEVGLAGLELGLNYYIPIQEATPSILQKAIAVAVGYKQQICPIQEQRQILSTVAKHFPKGLMILVDQEKVLFTDGQLYELLPEFNPAQVIGKPIIDSIPEPFREAVLPPLALAWQGQEVTTDLAYGEGLYQLTFCPIRTQEGQVTRILIVNQEVTEARHIQNQLAYQANILRHVNDAVIATDSQYHITFWNPAAEHIYGWTAEEVLGRYIYDLSPQDISLEEALASLRQLEQQGVWEGEITRHTKDGRLIHLYNHSRILRDEQGNLLGAIGVNRDITAQKAAQDQLAYQAQLLAQVSDAVMGVDMDFHITAWNPAAERLYGWQAEEVQGKNAVRLLQTRYVDPSESREKAYQQLLNTGLWQGQVIHAHKDGHEMYIMGSTTLIKDAQGQTIGAVAINRDITAQKAAQDQLAYQAQLLAQVNDAVIATDLNFNVTAWNPAAERLYGWQAEEVLGKKVEDFLHTIFYDRQPDWYESRDQLFQVGKWHGEVIQSHRNGGRIFILSSVSMVKNAQGQTLGVVAVNHDITELKMTQLQVTFESSLLEHIRDAVIATDKDFNVIYWNQGAEALYGWTASEMLGQKTASHFQTQFQGSLTRDQALQQLWREGVFQAEVRQLHKDGHRVDVFLSIASLKNDSGDIIGTVGINYDMTHQKESERQRLALQTEKQRATLLRQFIGHTTHDLMTPISSMKTGLYLIQRTSQEERTQRYLTRLNDQVEKMQRLLNNLLTMLNLDEMTYDQLHLGAFDLNTLIQEVVQEHGQGQPFETHLTPDLPPIQCDRSFIKRAILELIHNATRYNPPDRPIILRTLYQGHIHILEIEDHGKGIAPNELTHIFERFYRADSARNTDQGGGGLGLAMVKRIAEVHHGSANAESLQGQYTRFRLVLPDLLNST